MGHRILHPVRACRRMYCTRSAWLLYTDFSHSDCVRVNSFRRCAMVPRRGACTGLGLIGGGRFAGLSGGFLSRRTYPRRLLNRCVHASIPTLAAAATMPAQTPSPMRIPSRSASAASAVSRSPGINTRSTPGAVFELRTSSTKPSARR
jgi:hypothetical protein